MKLFPVIAFAAASIATLPPALAQDNCNAPGFTDLSVGELLSDIAAADAAQVIRLEGCSGAPAEGAVEALMANEATARVLQQEAVGGGEIIAVGSEDGAIIVYVGGDGDGD